MTFLEQVLLSDVHFVCFTLQMPMGPSNPLRGIDAKDPFPEKVSQRLHVLRTDNLLKPRAALCFEDWRDICQRSGLWVVDLCRFKITSTTKPRQAVQFVFKRIDLDDALPRGDVGAAWDTVARGVTWDDVRVVLIGEENRCDLDVFVKGRQPIIYDKQRKTVWADDEGKIVINQRT